MKYKKCNSKQYTSPIKMTIFKKYVLNVREDKMEWTLTGGT